MPTIPEVKTCFALGLQEQLLPQPFIQSIPNSTLHYWKNDNPNKYLGSDYTSHIQAGLDDTLIFLDRRLAFSRKAFVQFGKLYLTIITLIGKENFTKLIKANRNTIVNLLENLPDNFPIAKKDLCR